MVFITDEKFLEEISRVMFDKCYCTPIPFTNTTSCCLDDHSNSFLVAESPAGVIKVTKPTPPPPPPASQQIQGITQKEAKEAPNSLGGSREEIRVRFVLN